MNNIIDANVFKEKLRAFSEQFNAYVSQQTLSVENFNGIIKYNIDGSNIDGNNVPTYIREDKAPKNNVEIDVPNKEQIISIQEIADIIMKIVESYCNMHFTSSKWYFNDDGTQVLVGSKGGYLNTVDNIPSRTNQKYAYSEIPLSVSNNAAQKIEIEAQFPVSNDIVIKNTLTDIMNNLYSTWKNSLSSLNYDIYTCHYVCHSNYINRTRR